MKPQVRKLMIEVLKALGPDASYEASVQYLEKSNRRITAPWNKRRFGMMKTLVLREHGDSL